MTAGAKHTPGPWRRGATPHGRDDHPMVIYAPETETAMDGTAGFALAEVYGDTSCSESDANARLIAAAPALADKAQRACDLYALACGSDGRDPGSVGLFRAAMDDLRAAIAKATGGAE